MERTTAVFHERERVDSAVRWLTEEGIGEEDILIEPAMRKVDPHHVAGLSHRMQFAGLGAAIGMITGIAIGGVGDPLGGLWLVIVGSLAGVLLGGLVGLLVGAVRHSSAERHVGRDWLVSVSSPDENAPRVRRVLSDVGGELVTGHA